MRFAESTVYERAAPRRGVIHSNVLLRMNIAVIALGLDSRPVSH